MLTTCPPRPALSYLFTEIICVNVYFLDFCFVGYSFIRHDNKDCLNGQDIHFIGSDSSSDYENCKQWCTDNNDCGGFVGTFRDKCFFKGVACKDDLRSSQNVHVYLKEVV